MKDFHLILLFGLRKLLFFLNNFVFYFNWNSVYTVWTTPKKCLKEQKLYTCTLSVEWATLIKGYRNSIKWQSYFLMTFFPLWILCSTSTNLQVNQADKGAFCPYFLFLLLTLFRSPSFCLQKPILDLFDVLSVATSLLEKNITFVKYFQALPWVLQLI